MAVLDGAGVTAAAERAPGEEAGRAARPLPVAEAADCAAALATLVALARAGRIDLRRVSVAEAAARAVASLRAGRLEPAAEALTLAAELALLKSALLLPALAAAEPPDRAPADPELAFARRLAIRAAAERLSERPRLGRDVFARGRLEASGAAASPPEPRPEPPQADVVALVRAYAEVRMRNAARAPLPVRRALALTVGRALAALGARLQDLESWSDWSALVSPLHAEAAARRADPRSAPAAAFAAALELTRAGRLELRQQEPFGPISVRRRAR